MKFFERTKKQTFLNLPTNLAAPVIFDRGRISNTSRDSNGYPQNLNALKNLKFVNKSLKFYKYLLNKIL